MLKNGWGQKRRGSILATSISLVAVFLTLVLGSMTYVQNSMSSARTDRLRMSAEEAARSGLELVLGWAEANIDQETRLPKAWDNMSDGAVIDPIREIMENTSAATPKITSATKVGDVVGTRIDEYVVGRQGAYLTSFKARVQQFRISEDMPRQYRIGVIGRVRKLQSAKRDSDFSYNNIDENERESIVAERVVVATLGKEVTSRYAALIDIDGVQNWVPGEVVTGPVHINRGYIDTPQWRDSAVTIKDNNGTPPGVTGVAWKDIRSTMMLYIEGETGNVGFKAQPGAKKHPVFEQQVSLTDIPGGSTTYKNADPATSAAPISIKVNNVSWHSSTANAILNTYHKDIFIAPENSTATRYGANGSTNYRGPLIVGEPVELPRSVRNEVGAAAGLPGELADEDRWKTLENGVYVPTPRFWAISDDATLAMSKSDPPKPDSYRFGTGQAPVAGIYIRGEVEAMRMGKGTGANAKLSWYLLQVSSGINAGAGNRRCYLIVADRTTKQLAMHRYLPAVQSIHNDVIGAAGKTTAQLLSGAGLTGAWTPTSSADVAAFRLTAASEANAYFAAPQYSAFPFNGVIYVDCSKDDPARPSTGAALKSMATTGNILALGNLGAVANPATDKTAFAVDGVVGETVATYAGTDRTAPASKLTIMARGNIFIQNHLLVDGVFEQYKIERGASNDTGSTVNAQTGTGAARDALGKIRLDHSRDVLGLVSDKQVVVGAAAPTVTPQTAANKTKAGVIVMASIAALGDPAYRPWAEKVDSAYLSKPLTFVGSFTTEGLMQAYNMSENYYINNGTGLAGSYPSWTNATKTIADYQTDAALYSAVTNSDKGYPGNPIYAKEGRGAALLTLAKNPNIIGTRGRMIVFGAITQKKRGIVGQGNQSYDKDFVYDKRLLTIAPPVFPSSVNVMVRTQSPFSPDSSDTMRALPYAKGAGAIKQVGALDFLGATPAGVLPTP